MRIWTLHPQYLDPQGLVALWRETLLARGYSFDRRKIGPLQKVDLIPATSGQVMYEWQHLLEKLSHRNPALYEKWRNIEKPKCHPLFRVKAGGVESWEKVR